MGWIDAHEFVEQINQIQDKQLIPIPKAKMKKIIKERNEKVVVIKREDNPNIKYYINKLITYSMNNTGKRFRMYEILDNDKCLLYGQYKKVYDDARFDLLKRGYQLTKPKRGYYLCRKVKT